MASNSEYQIVVTAREQAELLPTSYPEASLADDEIEGRTIATLVSAGTELAYFYTGANFPGYPGYTAVFEVERVGAAVKEFAPGNRVFLMGPHRSFQRCKAIHAIPVPANLSPTTALFARMMCVTMSTLTTTTARPPQMVMISGLGPVGHLAAKVFAACGYDVIAIDPSESRRNLLKAQGVRKVLPSAPLEDKSIADQVALVVECSGHERGVLDGCKIVRKRGEVVLVGVPWTRKTDLTAHELLHAIFHRYVVLRSGWEWELPGTDTEFRTGSIQGNLRAALTWLAEGRIDVEGLSEIVSPRNAQTVFQDLLHNRGKKLVMIFDWEKKISS